MADSAKTIAKNTTALFVAGLIGRALSILLITVIARQLGQEGMGVYSFAFAFIGLAGLLGDFGIGQLVVRELAKSKEEIRLAKAKNKNEKHNPKLELAKKTFYNFFTIKITLGLTSLLIALILSFFVTKTHEALVAVWIIAFASFLLDLSGAFTTLFTANEQLEYSSISIVLERIITTTFGIIALLLGGKVIALMLAFAFSYTMTFSYLFIITLKKFFPLKIAFDINVWKRLFAEGAPFLITTIFITSYNRLDTILLSFFTNYSVVGQYNAAHNLLDALYFVPASVVVAAFPTMSRLSALKEELKGIFNIAFKYLFITAIPIGILTTILADKVILLLYGPEFSGSAFILQIIIWAEVIIFVSYLCGYLLNSIGYQKLFMMATGTGLIANIVLNIALIPKFGPAGTAASLVITELIVFLMLIYFSAKKGFTLNFSILAKPAIAGAIMLLPALYIKSLVSSGSPIIELAVISGVSMAIYLGILYAIGGLKIDEIRNIMRR